MGGLTEAKRVCDFAEDKGVLVVPHCWKSAIGIAASTHLSATTLSCPYIEFLPKELAESQLRKDLVLEELPLNNHKKVLVFSPAFTADCLETIIEIGDEYQELFIEAGGEILDYVPSLNYSDKWAESIIDIANIGDNNV